MNPINYFLEKCIDISREVITKNPASILLIKTVNLIDVYNCPKYIFKCTSICI